MAGVDVGMGSGGVAVDCHSRRCCCCCSPEKMAGVLNRAMRERDQRAGVRRERGEKNRENEDEVEG